MHSSTLLSTPTSTSVDRERVPSKSLAAPVVQVCPHSLWVQGRQTVHSKTTSQPGLKKQSPSTKDPFRLPVSGMNWENTTASGVRQLIAPFCEQHSSWK